MSNKKSDTYELLEAEKKDLTTSPASSSPYQNTVPDSSTYQTIPPTQPPLPSVPEAEFYDSPITDVDSQTSFFRKSSSPNRNKTLVILFCGIILVICLLTSVAAIIFGAVNNKEQGEIKGETVMTIKLSSEDIDDLNVKVRNLENAMQLMERRLNSLDGQHNSTRSMAQSALSLLNGQLNMTISSVDSLTSRVTALQQSLDALGGVQTKFNNQLINMRGMTNSIQAELNETSNVLDSVTARLSSVENNQNVLSTQQVSFRGEFSELQTSVGSINGTLSAARNDLSSLNARYSVITTSITTIDSTQRVALQNITMLQSFIKVFDTNLNATRDNVASLLEKSTNFDATIRMLRLQQNTTLSDVTTLQSTLGGINRNLTSVMNNVLLLADNIVAINVTSDLQGLTANIATLQTMLTMTNNQISTARNDLTSLTSRTSSLEGMFRTANSAQMSIRSDLQGLQSNISSLNTQLNSTLTAFNSLNTRVGSEINLFRQCYKDVASCTVIQHAVNDYWYRCDTPYRSVNVTGYYPLNVRCQHDPDTRYIDSTYIEIQGGSVRCNCNVVGITAAGSHAGIFPDPPTGQCSLVITRCPLAQRLFS